MTLTTKARAKPAAESHETIELWQSVPGGMPVPEPQEQIIERASAGQPQDRVAVHIVRPQMTVFRPAKPNGAAVLVIPGGGFVRVAIDKEGYETARWLCAQGITAFVLRYRMPGDGWNSRALAPLQDAQRAMRLIRARAADFSLNSERVAVIGFSAGGHVAAMLSTSGEAQTYEAADSADTQKCMPAVTGLIYPVISMGDFAHAGSRAELLGTRPTESDIKTFSANQRVNASAPPTILFHAQDDTTVPLDNSLLMYSALRRAAVPAELHLFTEGGHGFGLRLPKELPASRWPEIYAAFAERQRLW